MSIIEIILLSFGLAMDAFAVSICKGLTLKKMDWKKSLIAGGYFGVFQAIMPLIGYFLIKLFKVKKFHINFILSFGIILLIELFQYVFKVGVLDIDDLIICTLGMMLFYVCYNLLIKRNK